MSTPDTLHAQAVSTPVSDGWFRFALMPSPLQVTAGQSAPFAAAGRTSSRRPVRGAVCAA